MSTTSAPCADAVSPRLLANSETTSDQEKNKNRVIEAKPRATLKHSSDVVDVYFLPDAADHSKSSLATVSSEGEASVWSVDAKPENANAETQKEIAKAETQKEEHPEYKLHHDAKILTLSSSPDGRWIITGGKDRVARVWHALDGRPVGIFRHSGPVKHAWLLEDNHLMTASQFSRADAVGLQVKLWNLSTAPVFDSSQLETLAARKASKMRLETLNLDEVRDLAESFKPTGASKDSR